MTECQQINRLLPGMPDGDLAPAEARLVETHLAACADCRREAAAFGQLRELIAEATPPPPSLPTGTHVVAWIMEQETARFRIWDFGFGIWDGRESAIRPPARSAIERPRWGPGVALAVLVAAALFSVRVQHPPAGERASQKQAAAGDATAPIRKRTSTGRSTPASQAAWKVARLSGTPVVGVARVRRSGRLKVGEWLETDRRSRAQIDVADIGHVEIEPNSRVRLVETRAEEHRLRLQRGAMSAKIDAPPRLFFVETPSAVAVDLGCSYTLRVNDAGRGLLQVKTGWVALTRDGREAIVPEGARCQTRPGIGPGTPYLADAPVRLRSALAELDFADGGSRALGVVLATARRRDSLTLWHLLPQVAETDRGRVYDRLKILTPPPAGVTRRGVLRRDATMLGRWREKIEELFWNGEYD